MRKTTFLLVNSQIILFFDIIIECFLEFSFKFLTKIGLQETFIIPNLKYKYE